MRSVQLLKSDDLENFREKFIERGKNPIAMIYLQQAFVRGFLRHGVLVGGYVVNVIAPLRYHCWIPNDSRSTPDIQNYFMQKDACEITCIWIDRGGVTKLQRNLIYLMSVVDALAQRRQWILGGATNPKVAAIQMQVLRRLIYRGKVNLPGTPDGEVYCSSWWQLAGWMLVAFVRESSLDIARMSARSISAAFNLNSRRSGRGPRS